MGWEDEDGTVAPVVLPSEMSLRQQASQAVTEPLAFPYKRQEGSLPERTRIGVFFYCVTNTTR